MKVRIGFVSNSSSASYCLLGFDASSLKGIDFYEMIEERGELPGMSYLSGGESGLKDEQTIVGSMISWAPDGDYAETKLVDVVSETEKVKSARKKLQLEHMPIKLYVGTAMA